MNKHYENATARYALASKAASVYEDDEPCAPYKSEVAFYSTVAAGDVEKTRMLMA